ncbi:siderophore ABC transporter substrate-binding protein [Paenibacillus ehimensis]|uniref:Siderophore ABC transporter substrate-binding protein n=1 Tax=Paenibacillus ehimensis TaxID=79264 RepID=A0ABT8VLM8_9BACL|nr:siderophore ABC transporter substrate-binding protein [Paenibacillus ehimensis]MDO3681880.1 siderophore ABC transporter substrate-binding protein [Paenibacillus ehimensis]
MKKVSWMLMMLLLAVMVAACGSNGSGGANNAAGGANSGGDAKNANTAAPKDNEELTVKHKLGETKVKKNPKKVVVFDFGTLDSLDKLGVEVAGVPSKNLPSYLSKYKDAKYANVGGLMEPDFEKINQLKPDLIIISARQSTKYEEFKAIAPTIFMGVDEKNYMKSFEDNVKLLGQIFGKEAAAEKELAAISDSVKKLKEKASAGGKTALIILTTGGKTSAYGQGSRFGIIHDEFGFAPADKDIKVETHGQSVTFEYVAQKDPDYLFVVDRDAVVGNGTPAKQIVENELTKKTKAYKNGKIIYLDSNYWYLSGGGLLSVAEMVKEAEKAVQ